MSTRSVVAKPYGAGFRGRYIHWDGYPTGVGAELFRIYREVFKCDLKAMLKTLIVDHPAGWSSIFGDWSKGPGFVESLSSDAGHAPSCYCHGDRHEKGNTVTDKNASDVGCEWAYVLFTGKDHHDHMSIRSSFCDPDGKFAGEKMIGAFGCGDPKAVWREIWSFDLTTLALTGEEPNWKAVEEMV
jgi:hypothetical protein